MRARFINEKKDFQRGSTPFKTLDIGRMEWSDLKDGDILYVKYPFSSSAASEKISSQYTTSRSEPVKEGSYVVLYQYKGVDRGNIRTHIIPRNTLEEAKKMRKEVLEYPGIHKPGLFYIWGPEEQFHEVFDIVQKGQLQENMNFDRNDPNPLRKMGIGRITWDKMREGAILHPKKDVGVDRKGKFVPPGGETYPRAYRYLDTGWYLLVTSVGRTELDQGILSVKYYQCWDLEEAKSRSKNWKEYQGLDPHNYIRGTFQQFEKRFEIINPDI